MHRALPTPYRPSADFAALLPAGIAAPARPVAVGWSGGADSTALLLALLAAGVELRAWHIDHAWREESAVEAVALARLAGQWGVPFFSVRLQLPPSVNREAEARKARYAQFRQWALEQGVDTLFLGHHRDDQAETVCMRMLQGAGVAGCCGMHSVRSLQGLRLMRPLLDVSRTTILRLLDEAGIGWIEDGSNRDTTLWRNKIRHQLFPAIQRAGGDPAGLFLRWQRQAERLAGELGEKLAEIPFDADEDGVSMAWRDWCAASAPVRAGLLQRMVGLALGDGATPGRRHILLAEQWTQRGGRGGLDLSRCRLERRKGRLHLQSPLAMLG